jgi:hypothetical protein
MSEDDDSPAAPIFVFVDAAGAGDPAGTAYTIQYCPAAPAGTRLLVASVLVDATVLVEPRVADSYLWRAFVTPFGLGSAGPDPTQIYELRALVPVPQTLTLDTRYDAKTHRAVLSGQVTALGRPAARVPVRFAAHSAHVEFASFGPAKTDATGKYSLTWPIAEKTDFTATVEAGGPAACPPDPVAPAGGCASLTTSTPPDQTATVRLPRRGDPKRLPRSADQALAAQVNVKLPDLPADWQMQSVPADVVVRCPEVRTDESKLTLTGVSYSPFFFKGSFFSSASLQYVTSVVKIWKTAAEAKVAFARETPAAQLRCLIDDPEILVLKAAPFPSPHLGRASSAYRLVILDEDEGGNQYTSYLDLVVVLGRRSLVAMSFESEDASSAIEKKLGQVVARRAARV